MAAATLVPYHTFYMMFFGPVRIVYIVAIYILMSYVSIAVNQNAGGNMAHLGGALLGYLYIVKHNIYTNINSSYVGL